MQNFPLWETLIGEAIGLTHAATGHEFSVDADTHALLRIVLSSAEDGKDVEKPRFDELLQKITNEKLKVAPDCAVCASPCGRSKAYDLEEIRSSSPKIRELKTELLKNLVSLAANPEKYEENRNRAFELLSAVGDEWSEESLLKMVKNINWS